MNRNWRTWVFTGLVSVIGGLLPAAFSPASAQAIVPDANKSVPQDWSHRHVVIRAPDTMKEASGKGAAAYARWQEKLKDPRFTMAVARKTIDVQPTANKVFSGQQLAYGRGKGQKPVLPVSSLKRDWSVALGNATAVDGSGTGTGVGSAGMFPAKFTWDLNATPSCANDFLVYSTMTPGATSGTSARQTLSFVAFDATSWSGVNGGNGTLTITNGASSITLTATTVASATSNTGRYFYMGAAQSSNSPAYYAYNLAAAINRNSQTVGVSATSSGGVVTIIATTVGTPGNSIALSKNAAFTNLTLGGATLAGGAATGVQPTLVAYNQLYKTTCQATQTNPGSPNIRWQVNTGTGAIVETSPALSMDGSQVAFVQRTSAPSTTSTTQLSPGQTAELVLLKWSATGPTMSAPPLAANAAAYRGCAAPCMFKLPLNANNQNSSPYVDYANDVIYVGDAYGRLHKFTGVFYGNPAAAASWPVTVSTGNMLSSPVFDSTSNNVFVGSDVSERVDNTDTGSGGKLHAIKASDGSIVSSGQIAAFVDAPATENVKLTGVRDGAIVDSMAQRVYAFLESDTATSCGGVTHCKSVYQFPTNFAANSLGTAVQVGRGQIPGRVMYVGQFDDAYWSSTATSPSGALYACGSVDGGNSRAPTLWRIPITNNVIGAATAVVTMTSTPGGGEVGASCSPITTIKNGAKEYLFTSVTANGNVAVPGCTGACIYQFEVAAYTTGISYDTTTPAGQTVSTAVKYMSVSTSANLNTTEATVQTTLATAATFTSIIINQTGATGITRSHNYLVRKNGANTTLGCNVAAFGNTSCSGTGSVLFAAGDKIDVSVVRSGGGGTDTAGAIRVQLAGPPPPSPPITAGAGLAAAGGTSGIVVDNISSTAGASQVYFSTLDRPGRAVQASQAGLN
jgi:hypothetical protein